MPLPGRPTSATTSPCVMDTLMCCRAWPSPSYVSDTLRYSMEPLARPRSMASGFSCTGDSQSRIWKSRWPEETAREKLLTIHPIMRTGMVSSPM